MNGLVALMTTESPTQTAFTCAIKMFRPACPFVVVFYASCTFSYRLMLSFLRLILKIMLSVKN